MQIQTDSTLGHFDSPELLASIKDCASIADTSTLLSLDEYHLLVKRLAERLEMLEEANCRLSVERDAARGKLKVQHRLIEHLRTRLDVVTGLEIPVDGDQAVLPSRAARKVSGSGAARRLRTDSYANAAESVADENIPAIDPAEFLPIDDSMLDSIWVRRVREIGRRCRAFTSGCWMMLDQHMHGLSHRART